MNVDMQLVEKLGEEMKSMREGYGEEMVEIGKKNNKVVALVADLAESLRVKDFGEEFPERLLEMGIAEQNMIGVAAGLAMNGFIPVVNSFACFSPGRNWEQFKVSVCLTNENVKVVGGHAGVGNGEDGANQQSFEDVAIARVLPNLVALEPCDYEQVKKATRSMIEHEGAVYMRITKPVRGVITTKMTPFEIGKAQVFRKGGDVGIIASGGMVFEAIMAAEELVGEVDCEVLNVHTIKPIDKDEILRVGQKCKRIVVAQEHQVIGGLGSAVCEVLAEEGVGARVEIVGMRDTFGESGKPEEVLRKYGVDRRGIMGAVKRLM